MVGELRAGKAAREAVRIEWQYRRVLLVPFSDEPLIDVAVALLRVYPLHRIFSNIEQKGVVEDLEVLPIAVAPRAGRYTCSARTICAGTAPRAALIPAANRCRQKRHLLRHNPAQNPARPPDHGGDARAPFEQRGRTAETAA